jgi:hypothetical protein
MVTNPCLTGPRSFDPFVSELVTFKQSACQAGLAGQNQILQGAQSGWVHSSRPLLFKNPQRQPNFSPPMLVRGEEICIALISEQQRMTRRLH